VAAILPSSAYFPATAQTRSRIPSIEVKINADNRRLVARTRNGYTAPKEGDRSGVRNMIE
jgi:hypothetical protein